MTALRVGLVVGWLATTGMLIYAIRTLGSDAGMVFVTDFSHPWRAQFNTDFLMHVLLVMTWIVYREKSLVRGLVLALPAVMGGPYTFVYVLVATYTAKGSFHTLLLGNRVR